MSLPLHRLPSTVLLTAGVSHPRLHSLSGAVGGRVISFQFNHSRLENRYENVKS